MAWLARAGEEGVTAIVAAVKRLSSLIMGRGERRMSMEWMGDDEVGRELRECHHSGLGKCGDFLCSNPVTFLTRIKLLQIRHTAPLRVYDFAEIVDFEFTGAIQIRHNHDFLPFKGAIACHFLPL
jgi:hypothetical protein